MENFEPFLRSLESETKPTRIALREAQVMAQAHPEMRQALFAMTLHAFFKNDFALGKHLLRLLIHMSIGFEALAKELNMVSNNLMRMFSSHGNPTSKNLFQILSVIQRHQHMTINVEVLIPRLNFEPYTATVLPNS